MLGRQAVVLLACSPGGSGHRTRAPEYGIVTVEADIQSSPPCLPHKKILAVSHAFPHMRCRIYLFILWTCELQALAWQEGEEFFVLFLVWGRGGWEGAWGSSSELGAQRERIN